MMLMLLSAFFFCHVMLTDNAVERSLFVTFGAVYIPVYSPFGITPALPCREAWFHRYPCTSR